MPLQPAFPTAATDAHGWMPLHYVALRGDLALFVLLFSPSAPSLAAADAAGAALLTAAIRGGSSEMVGILLLTGATSPQVCPASRYCGASLDRAVAGQATRWCVFPCYSLQVPLAMPHRTPHLPALPQKCREAGQMPVHAAAREGCLDVLQFLYGAGFDMTGVQQWQVERDSNLAPDGSGQLQSWTTDSLLGCATSACAGSYNPPFAAVAINSLPPSLCCRAG